MYSKMQIDQREYETFKILHKIKEDSKALRIIGLLYFSIRSNFRGGKIDFLITNSTDKLLFSNFIWFWPILILTTHDATVQNNPFHLINNSLRHKYYNILTLL